MIQTPIIWNITNRCPYNCSFCCLDANSSVQDASLEDKLKIVENLDSPPIRIDFSGGEPLLEEENLIVLKKLAEKFGRERISITSTGKGLERIDLEELRTYVIEVGFTYDFPTEPSPDRPLGFNRHNLLLAREASKKGIKTLAQTPLIKSNIDPSVIKEIYLNLRAEGINELLLMRFSESGRGNSRRDLSLNQNKINKAVRNYRRLEQIYGSPRIKITPSIKGKVVGRILTSLNISNGGLLLSSPWSYDSVGRPKERYVLGDLTKDKLSYLAGAKVYQRFLTQLRRNI
jgi:MoaA/NifB/PqqE/SkfB family radical SAM enzyme